MDILQAKESVIEAGLELVRSGMIARTWGNVSCRIDDDTFAITPSGRAYENITAEDIVICRVKDASYKGNIRPSSEKGIHALVYRNLPDASFIIHTHQKYASVVSACSIKSLPWSGSKIIPISPYGPPGSKKLMKAVGSKLNLSHGALIMSNHGALYYGKDVDEAFYNAIDIEKACYEFIKKTYMDISGASTFDLNEMRNYYYKKFPAKRKYIRPMLDDYAQIIGSFEKSYSDIGLKNLGDDKSAIQFIAEKNELAEMCATFIGDTKPLPLIDCIIMRLYYLKKYSKLK